MVIRLRILHIIPYFSPAWRFGGPVKVAYDISRKLVENGHSVTVYTSDILDEKKRVDSAYKKIEGIDVYYFRNLSTYAAMRKIYITPSLLSALKDIKSFDVVHVHGNRTTQGPLIHYFLKRGSVPYVVQSHGGLPNDNMAILKRFYDILFGNRLLTDAAKVIALTPMEAKQYQNIGIPETKIEIVPNGLDLSEYNVLPPKNSFRKKLSIGFNQKIVLYLARINRIKGVDILVRAFANLVERLDDVILVIAGPDDGYLSDLKVLVNTLKIRDKVLICGPLYGKDKIEAFVDADIYVLPSRYEAFGISVLESIACRTPVILTENCGLASNLQNKVGIVTKADPKYLSDSLFELLVNQHKQELFRENCCALGEEISLSKITSKLEEIYTNIVSDINYSKSKTISK